MRDLIFRQRIIDTLGEDIFSASLVPGVQNDLPFSGNGGLQQHTLEAGGAVVRPQGSNTMAVHGPMTEKQMIEKNSAQNVLAWVPSGSLDDWYN